jgi:uncharacterized protein (TIGR00297 family)
MSDHSTQWILLGLVASTLIGAAGYARGALSRSGLAGAIVAGTITFGFGGWEWGTLLIAFFVSSSLLSRFRRREKANLAEKFAKGHKRDWGQVLANGGLGAVLAIAAAVFGLPAAGWLWAAYVGAMATVNADTWATELGVLSRARPRLITNGQRVEVGTSGGVSKLGTAAAMGGAFFIAALAALLQWAEGKTGHSSLQLALAGVVGGVLGAFFDSLLGATVQGIYYCDQCNKETERSIHGCNSATRPVRGWRWLTNDWVNALSSGFGAAATVGLVFLVG